jgi:2-haloacid dehalogenase
MKTPKRRGIQACVFDAYGTLFDFNTAASRCRDALGNEFDRLNLIWREKQLQYSWLRSLQGSHADFWRVTGDALDFAMDCLELKNSELRGRLMETYLQLELFPEVKETLTQLRSLGLRTAILSNGSPGMLKAVIEYNGISNLFDRVFSIEEVGVYKPHPKAYGIARAGLGLDREEILFHSANAWDAYGASVFGMRAVWCNRYGQRPERLPGKPEFELKTLAESPVLLGAI